MEELLLFISAFLAATILPLSSELTFIVALENGMPKYTALFFASSGNVLAIILNYFLGYVLYDKTKDKLNTSKIARKSLKYAYKHSYLSLALSWLPLIGDPLTLVAGLLRMSFIVFITVAGTLRILRYYFLSFMM